MKTIIYTLVSIVLLFVFQKSNAQTPPPPDGKKWITVPELTDEFDGNVLDDTKWDDYHPHWTGRPPSKFKKGNAFVEDGYLKLRSTLLKDPDTVDDPNVDIWVNSAACVSKQKSAKPGYYYEARMKASSLSMSSSFWFRVGQYSEIDVIEHIGNQSNPQSETLGKDLAYQYHTNAFDYTGGTTQAVVRNEWFMPTRGRDEFHVYGLWWKDPNTLIFYHNGEEVMKTVPPIAFEENLKMIFDTEVFPMYTASWGTAGLPKPVNLNNNEMNTMSVDWIRTYKLADDDGSIDDEIFLVDPQLEVESKTSYSFDVGYKTSSSDREVLVSFWNDNQWLAAETINVESGEGIQQVIVNLNEAPEPGDKYVYKYHIRPRGTTFAEATADGEIRNVIVNESLSLPENVLETLGVYPNPTKGVVSIKGILSKTLILIYDYTGRELLTQYIDDTANSIDIGFLTTGVYLIKAKGYKMEKIVVK